MEKRLRVMISLFPVQCSIQQNPQLMEPENDYKNFELSGISLRTGNVKEIFLDLPRKKRGWTESLKNPATRCAGLREGNPTVASQLASAQGWTAVIPTLSPLPPPSSKTAPHHKPREALRLQGFSFVRLHSRRPTLGLRGKATAPTRHISLKGARATAPSRHSPPCGGCFFPHHATKLFTTSQNRPRNSPGDCSPGDSTRHLLPRPRPGTRPPPQAAILQPTPPPCGLGLLGSRMSAAEDCEQVKFLSLEPPTAPGAQRPFPASRIHVPGLGLETMPPFCLLLPASVGGGRGSENSSPPLPRQLTVVSLSLLGQLRLVHQILPIIHSGSGSGRVCATDGSG